MSQEGFKSGVNHAQVVKPSRRHKLAREAPAVGRTDNVEREVEVYDVGSRHAEFFGQEVEQRLSGVLAFGRNADDGEHVFLFGKFHAFVHLAVKVDGQVGYLQQRSADVQQAADGM